MSEAYPPSSTLIDNSDIYSHFPSENQLSIYDWETVNDYAWGDAQSCNPNFASKKAWQG